MTDDRTNQREDPLPSIRSMLPGLVRVAATSWWRATRWTAETAVSTTSAVASALASGESAGQALTEATAELRSIARDVLGMAIPEVAHNSDPKPAEEARRRSHARDGATPEELRRRGAELLRDSADVWYEGETHPAYGRILSELSPDEARILRFLAIGGPQASVDVRTRRPLGVGSELVASGLSMIGLQAGVRNVGRTKAHLNNLYRLGLVWFSREEVADPSVYQVVEVQPDVQQAMKRAGRSPRTVHRSIHLTEFGTDFCAMCLPSNNGLNGLV